MTTGINNAIRSVGVRPEPDVRSIVEIEEEINSNGYQNLSDSEIEHYIAYKEHMAEIACKNRIMKDDNDAMINDMQERFERLKKEGF